jgi:hypothetical protein
MIAMQFIHAQTPTDIDQLATFLKATMPREGWRVSFSVWREKRSLSQNAFQHVVYQEISDYLIKRGRKDCTPEWVKDMLKNKFLGWTEREFVDVVTGQKQTREVQKSSAALDMGAANHYITQILEWASSIGLEIRVPADCEYRKLAEKQNE